jgi:hypothetical protein
MGGFSTLRHSPSVIRDELVSLCKQRDILPKNGEYQIRLSICEEYLCDIFDNLPTRVIHTLLDYLVLCGAVETRRGKGTKRWYIIIRDRDAGISSGEAEDAP